MAHKQRFIAALKGLPTDRVPVVPKIWVDVSARITGTPLEDVITDPMTALRVIARAGQMLGLDAVRQFPFPPKTIIKDNGDCFEIDKTGRRIGKIDMSGGLSTHLFDAADYHLADPYTLAYSHAWSVSSPLVNSLQDARTMALPDRVIFDQLSWAANQNKVIDEFGDDLYFVGDCGSATISFYIAFRGIDNAMLDLILQPELVHAVMEKGVALAIEKGKYWLDHGIDVLRLNDSAGNMSLISPQHWKEFVFPHLKTVCDELHRYRPNALIYCHICGNVLPVMEQLVEAGLDCIGPLDPLGGFSVAQARQKVGRAVSLMGGVNTLTLLNGSPEQIKQEAFECLRQAGEGGFILGSGCAVPRGCPAENLRALVEASAEYRG